MTTQIDTIFSVEIEKIANGGMGIARHNGQVIFVPLSTPGDLLKVKTTKFHKNFIEAEIVDIIKPSPLRISPPCPYYSRCGGCNFQHINYESQLKIKSQLVQETLSKFLKTKDLVITTILASPLEFHYRNRIQLQYKDGKLGFNQRRSHSLVEIDDCLIAEKSLMENLSSTKEKLRHEKKINSQIASKKFEQELEKGEPESPGGSERVEIFLDKSLKIGTRWLDKKNEYPVFSQVNRFQNELLIQKVLDLSKSWSKKGEIWDLYSGSGNFGFPLLKYHHEVHKNIHINCVELSKELVEMGINQIKSHQNLIKFFHSSVELFLLNQPIQEFDLVILDPPRSGCDSKVMSMLGSQKKEKILYISCNPVTLGRDLALLKESARNWNLQVQISSIHIFDMFPQTDHIETLVELSVHS